MALIVYAPNVHTGGGRVLLQALADDAGTRVQHAILDARLQQTADVPFANIASLWVRNTLASRLYAEWWLWRSVRAGDTVLCLHSLPPLLRLRGRTVVLLQNRLVLGCDSLAAYPLKTRLRIAVERIWARSLQQHVQRYVVQTPCMAHMLSDWLSQSVPVSVVPFTPRPITPIPHHDLTPQFDFIYVASGEAHKNHRTLIRAWQLLAESSRKPSLALTVDAQHYPELAEHIAQHAADHHLLIHNFGGLTHREVDALYGKAGALIFPSLLESFGLPLIEATRHGLPILAAELDYVRDVTQPAQTFDPHSAVSIARAVRRYLGHAEATVTVVSAEQLLDEALQ